MRLRHLLIFCLAFRTSALLALLSDDCADTLAKTVSTSLSECSDSACKDNLTTVNNLRSLFGPVLHERCGLTSTNTAVRWLQYPGWHNGLLFDWLRAEANASVHLGAFNATPPEHLPPPDHVPDDGTMHELTDRSTSGFSLVSADVSATDFTSFLSAQQAYGSSSGMGFNHLPENSCANQAQPTGPLHPRTYLLLFYRADSLAALHAAGLATSPAPPDDWDSLLGLLRHHYEAVVQGAVPSLPRYGMCVTTSAGCGRLGDVLQAIAASVVQYGGAHTGYVFDLEQPPPEAVPLVSNAGWRHAAGMLQQLLKYNGPGPGPAVGSGQEGSGNSTCWGVSPAFLRGDCLFTLEWDAALPIMAAAPVLSQQGALGVAPLPGSKVVLGRMPSGNSGKGRGKDAAEVLLPCDSVLCAVSTNHDLLYTDPGVAGLAPATAAAAAVLLGPETHTTVLELFAAREAAMVARMGSAAHSQSYINRAPYSAAYAALFTVSYLGHDDSAIITIAFMQQFMAGKVDYFRSRRQNFTDALRRNMGYFVRTAGDAQNCSGYRSTLWWEALAPEGRPPDVRPLAAAAGLYDMGTATSYMRALWHAIHHPNAAIDAQSSVPVNWFKYAADYAALLLLPPGAPNSRNPNSSLDEQAAVQAAIALLMRLYEDAVEAFGKGPIREVYEASISAHPWQPPGNVDDGGLGSGQVAAIVSSLSVGLALTAALVVVLLLHRQRRKRHRDLLGRVVAPKVGVDTTLLVTDVQNSTVLWEQLPVEVMDVTLKLHHNTVRQLLPLYDGYESATEGDSFIVAFADPASAVAFAVAAQAELLVQGWPCALLSHPDAAPVVVVADPRVNGPAALGLATSRNPTGKKLSLPAMAVQGPPTPRRRSSFSFYPVSSAGTANPSAPFTAASSFGDPQTGRRISAMLLSPGSASPRFQGHMRVLGQVGDGSDQGPESLAGGRESLAGGRESLDEARGPVMAHAELLLPSSGFAAAGGGGGGGVAPPGGGGGGGVAPPGGGGGGGVWCRRGTCTWMDALASLCPLWVPVDGADLAEATGGEWLFKRNGLSIRLSDGRQGLVAYRGLRVRMGLHSGLSDPQHIAFNKVGSAFKYYGPFAEIAKSVSDAAPGGMITLSSAAFARLRNSQQAQQRERSVVRSLADSALVVYAGHHNLSDPAAVPLPPRLTTSQVALTLEKGTGTGAAVHSTKPAAAGAVPADDGLRSSAIRRGVRNLARRGRSVAAATPSSSSPPVVFLPHLPHAMFVAVHPSLVCRLALSPPLRTFQQTQVGSLGAPIGKISVVFMKVVGASTLLAEIPRPAARALDQFQQLACGLLGAARGYLVEGGDGLVLAAFGSPTAAVEWALDCLAGLKRLTWDEELLEHELCAEELVKRNVNGNSNGLAEGSGTLTEPPSRAQTVLHGGLRVKVGLDLGHATHSLTEASGRLSYRGKVMNRAARVAGIAGSCQVLCTGAVWDACEQVEGFCDRVVGLCLGRMNLKGIAQPVEVVQCSRDT